MLWFNLKARLEADAPERRLLRQHVSAVALRLLALLKALGRRAQRHELRSRTGREEAAVKQDLRIGGLDRSSRAIIFFSLYIYSYSYYGLNILIIVN